MQKVYGRLLVKAVDATAKKEDSGNGFDATDYASNGTPLTGDVVAAEVVVGCGCSCPQDTSPFEGYTEGQTVWFEGKKASAMTLDGLPLLAVSARDILACK